MTPLNPEALHDGYYEDDEEPAKIQAILDRAVEDGTADLTRAPSTLTDLVIGFKRNRINGLDQQIIDLLNDRRRVSQEIQDAKVEGGHARVSLGREREIQLSYMAALGQYGPEIARQIIAYCKA